MRRTPERFFTGGLIDDRKRAVGCDLLERCGEPGRVARMVDAVVQPDDTSAGVASLRERLDSAEVPLPFRGPAIALVTAGMMSLAFLGFAGLIRV